MLKFVSLEVYFRPRVGRAKALPGRSDRPGVEPGSEGSTPVERQALATRLAQAVQGAYGDGGTAAKACSPNGAYTWCAPQLPGAAFNPGWKTFETW